MKPATVLTLFFVILKVWQLAYPNRQHKPNPFETSLLPHGVA